MRYCVDEQNLFVPQVASQTIFVPLFAEQSFFHKTNKHNRSPLMNQTPHNSIEWSITASILLDIGLDWA